MVEPPVPPAVRRRALFGFLCFLSGAAGLMYEVVWMRMLIRTFGITVHAVGAITAFFIGGLALGSWLAGRLSLRERPWLRIYGQLELALGGAALIATLLLPKIPELSSGRLALSLPLSAACVLVPTLLMGATLPILLRGLVRADEEASYFLSSLYGLNTLGGVAGVLLAGFAALGAFGERRTALIAAAANILVGVVVLLLPGEDHAPRAELDDRPPPAARRVLLLMAVSGACAMGYQVLWARMFTAITGTSVYAFSALLAVFLAGIGLGSWAARRRIASLRDPWAAFGWAELALAAAALLGLEVYRLIGVATTQPMSIYSPLLEAGDVSLFFAAVAVIVLPPALLMGFIFPVAGRLCTPGRTSVGAVMGRVYAVNSAGCVLGSLVCGFVLIETLGIKPSFVALSVLTAGIGLAALLAGRSRLGPPGFAALAALAVLAVSASARSDPYAGVISHRIRTILKGAEVLFHADDTDATVTGAARGTTRILLVNGIVVSGNNPNGRLMAQLPHALHGSAERILVVCHGVGNTFQAARRLAPRVDVVELSRAVIDRAHRFYPSAQEDFKRPGVRVFVNDGRNHLLNRSDAYDIVIVDASPPIFSAGTVNLYSREFLSLVRKRLKPGGIFTLWVPLFCYEDDAWSIARGFSDVFPHAALWAHPKVHYGFFLLGSDRQFDWTESVLEKRAAEFRRDSFLRPVTPRFLVEGLLLLDEDLKEAVRESPPVTDDRPRTEFPLGRMLRGEPLQGDLVFLVERAMTVRRRAAPKKEAPARPGP